MTEVDFSRQLSELTTAAKELNQESDSINRLLSEFEQRIRNTNVGLEASVDIDVNTTLRWTKTQRALPGRPQDVEWGLALWVSAIGQRPVLEASRELRIAALDALPQLVGLLILEAKERVQKIQSAKKILKGEDLPPGRGHQPTPENHPGLRSR